MASGLRLGAHPLHPMLVHFPIALWTVAAGADLTGWIFGRAECWPLSFGCQALGVLIAALAMLAGFLDYASIARESPAQSVAVSHLLAISTAWLLFLVSLAMRGWPATHPPSLWATLVALGAWSVMAFGGWLGGRLVYEFGIGVAGRAPH